MSNVQYDRAGEPNLGRTKASSRYASTILPPNSNNAIAPKNEAINALKTPPEADFVLNCSDADRLLWRMIQRFGAEKSDSAIAHLR
ncbi:hypothetical protein H6G81_14125 [Scytonema hofmannii FACHB-248]|uniref:Uncharacterized protein n=1 Tax=Scytonema hofmannii FACHB-248 TaxID=1842502 RepID=A0ABR8GRH2_9CYAN|nr:MULTISPECIES: hypothetical protein [Nostocales]MBD2605634.1 hypothetical protein [Scytonema hofmannii FACHB-248]